MKKSKAELIEYFNYPNDGSIPDFWFYPLDKAQIFAIAKFLGGSTSRLGPSNFWSEAEQREVYSSEYESVEKYLSDCLAAQGYCTLWFEGLSFAGIEFPVPIAPSFRMQSPGEVEEDKECYSISIEYRTAAEWDSTIFEAFISLLAKMKSLASQAKFCLPMRGDSIYIGSPFEDDFNTKLNTAVQKGAFKGKFK